MGKKFIKSRYFLVTACIALLLLSVICSVFISTNQGNITVEATASLASGTNSIVNFDINGNIVDNFTSIIKGEQNESIYFGTNFKVGTNGNTGANAHNGAIKWRVLSANDRKYSNGNMLLWADYSIGTMRFNAQYYNPYYAFWGTSEMRAFLNGGEYLSDVGSSTTAVPSLNQTVAIGSSWFYNLFTAQERKNIVESKSYETKNYKYSDTSPCFSITGVVGTGDGQYSPTVLGTTTGAAKYVTTKTSSVIETTTDNLFLLDYYDVNNTQYGFGDSGQVYAKKVNSSWTENSTFYAGYGDNTTIRSNYLKAKADIGDGSWWLRNVGCDHITNSRPLFIHYSGVVSSDPVSIEFGVRPAFNFNPTNIIYATAADTSSIGSQFIQVGGTSVSPAYKVYLKSNTFTNYNTLSSGQPQIKISGSNVSVELSGKSGKAIFLVADKSGSGEVKYQAVADFNGSGIATATLPSGVDAENNSITVLFADSLRGDNYAETVTGSYSNVILDTPTKADVTYTGSKLTIDDVATAQKPWYDSTLIDLTYPSVNATDMIDVDTYSVKAEIKSAYRNNTIFSGTPNTSKGENAYTRYFDFEIKQKKVDFPTFLDGGSKPYNDGNNVLFTLVFDSTAIEIKHNGTAITGNQIVESAVNEYPLDVKLKDSKNCAWSSTPPTQFGFEITRKPIEVSLHDGNGVYDLTGMQGNKIKAELDMPNGIYIVSGETVDIEIYASITGVQPFLISTHTLDDTSREEDVELDLSMLPQGRTYDLEIKTKTGNYDIKLASTSPTKLTVTELVSTPILTWNLYIDGVKQKRQYIESKVGTDYDVTFASRTYDGKEYSFEVDLPNGYSLDGNYGMGGYLLTHTNTGNTNVGTNADTYTTSIRLKNDGFPNDVGEIYSIEFTIDKAKFDLSGVTWKGSGTLEFNGQMQAMILENLPDKLQATYGGDDEHRDVTASSLHVTVDYLEFVNSSDDENYVLPNVGDAATYDGTVAWEIDWNIIPKEIKVQWSKELSTDKNNNAFNVAILRGKAENTVVVHTYYKSDGHGNKIDNTPINVSDIVVPITGTDYYICELSLSSSDGYRLSGTLTREFAVSNQGTSVKFTPNNLTLQYTGKGLAPKFSNDANLQSSQYVMIYYSANGTTALPSAPTAIGKYRVEIKLSSDLDGKYFIGGDSEWEYEIVSRIIGESWNENVKPPRMNINKTELDMIEYEYQDDSGATVTYEQMKSKAGIYSVRAKIKSSYASNCTFASGKTETEWKDFELTEQDLTSIQDPTDPTLYPDDPNAQEPTNPDEPGSGDVSGDSSGNVSGEDKDGVDFDKIGRILKDWWQVIASGISIILIIIFISKGASNLSKAKKAKKATENRYKAYYATSATGLFGLAMNTWTIIASILMGLAVASLVFMILTKVKLNKAQEEMEEARYDYERHKESDRREYDDNRRDEEYRRRDEDERRKEEEYRRMNEELRQQNEDMKQMFMKMLGGNFDGMNMGQMQGAYAGMQQGIGADEIRGIVSETVTALLPGMQQAIPQQTSINDDTVNKLIEQNERLIQQLAEKSTEKIVEKEAVAASVNDETIKQMLANQEKLMQKVIELSANNNSQPQIIERVVEKPVEKIVEKVVEKPVIHVISTEAESGAEKSQQVKKGIDLSATVEVTEKKAEKPQPPKKAPAPRLTLEEAYTKLSKEQKKYFDGLREYAMKKDSKCKEKLSTYFTTIGPTTTNPLIKLTIKKGVTVALFKMEDEYLKDIRRNASSDGAKIKVKETEMAIPDAQSYDTAKDMIDLRIDQIERYEDFLKEQKAMRRK